MSAAELRDIWIDHVCYQVHPRVLAHFNMLVNVATANAVTAEKYRKELDALKAQRAGRAA